MQSQINPDAPVKEYTGVWIPADVMESEDLSPMEKLLYGEIAGFRECYASNAWLAGRIGRSERTVKRLISHMMELGFVENLGFNGRFRIVRVALPCGKLSTRGDKNDTPAVTKMSPIIIKSNNSNKLLLDKRPVEKSQYGNKNINELFAYWQERVGTTPSSNKANRNACNTLIRQRGVDGAKRVVDLIYKAIVSQDKFAPRVSSFVDLYGAYGKLPKLDTWQLKNSPKMALKRFQTANTANYEPSDAERAETLRKMELTRQKLFGVKSQKVRSLPTKRKDENDQSKTTGSSVVGGVADA